MELFVSMAIWWLPVILLLSGLQIARKVSIEWRWVTGAIAVFAIYSSVVFYAPSIPGFPAIDGAQYNWTGKIAAILTTLVMMSVAIRSSDWLTRERLGLTLRQNDGSLLPAMIATGAMVGLVVLLQMLGGDGPQADAETLAYQATIPGLDEEPIFRGLLLALVAAACAKLENAWRWAGIAVTVVFAIGHSFFWSSEGVQFDPIALAYVAILGGLLMFIRLRTGSIVIPILAHNLTNVVNKLV